MPLTFKPENPFSHHAKAFPVEKRQKQPIAPTVCKTTYYDIYGFSLPPPAFQEVTFYKPKGGLLQRKRLPFGSRKAVFRIA